LFIRRTPAPGFAWPGVTALQFAFSLFRKRKMKVLAVLLLWAILLVLCWPLALLVLVLWPFLWLLSIPFRIVGVVMEALIAFARAVLLLPARLLGER